MTTKYNTVVAKPRQQKIKAVADKPDVTKVKVKDVVRSDAPIDVYDGGEF
jgi:hypothetical protein